MKPIKIRKELLVAEAELLRSQMGHDLEVIREGIIVWEGQAKSVASYATIAATVLAGFAAFRRVRQTGKRSVFSTLLTGARLALTVLGAIRSRQR
jgi:hypothetical protein